jgi:hypothetical protein
LDEAGLADAWGEYYNAGSGVAVAYLESYFGFIFDEA